MRRVKLFVEDTGHKEVLNALLQRFARQHNILVEIAFENARRGHGRVITELNDGSSLIQQLLRRFWE